MTSQSRSKAWGIGAVGIVLAVVLSVFLTPPKPDLMAHSIKIVDLAGIDEFWFSWLDGHHLVATRGCCTPHPSVVSIDVSAKMITPLAAVNRRLEALSKASLTSSGVIQRVIPSPDGQWLYGSPYPGRSGLLQSYFLRIRDGFCSPAPLSPWSMQTYWLSDSRHLLSLYFAKGEHAIVYSVGDPTTKQSVPLPLALGTSKTEMSVSEHGGYLPRFCSIAVPKKYCRRRADGLGIVSPDGTRVAWLRQDDWLDDVPPWIKRALNACGYMSHTSGELWTTRMDGKDRQEIGQFGNQSSPPPRAEIENFYWTPDGKSLIFDRGRVLYSIPVPETSPR